MYSFIAGKVDSITTDSIIVDVHGIGYEIYSNNYAISNAKIGKDIKLFTHLNVRDDAMLLFGFLTQEEKTMYQMLISVSGIGPRIGMAFLSTLSSSDVAAAIISGDERILSTVPGVGKKTAQRVILELKSKVETEQITAPAQAGSTLSGDEVSEAISALVAMGFTAPDAASAIALIRADGGTSDEMVMRALRALDRK